MTKDKQIIIDVCPYQGECSVSGCKRNDDGCFVRQLFEERNRAENRIVELNKSIQTKEQECETLASQLDFEVQKKECLEQECERMEDKLDNIRDFANQGRDMFVQQGSFANWYKVAECMKNDFNFILYEIDDEE